MRSVIRLGLSQDDSKPIKDEREKERKEGY